jgi:hypothetical protein
MLLRVTAAAAVVLVIAIARIQPDRVVPLVEGVHSQADLDALLSSWGSHGVDLANWSLAVDFLLIPAYVFAVGLACVITCERVGHPWLRVLGIAAAGLQYVAGTADVVENIFVALLIGRGFSSPQLTIAIFATSVKWVLLVGGIMSAALLWLVSRVRTT